MKKGNVGRCFLALGLVLSMVVTVAGTDAEAAKKKKAKKIRLNKTEVTVKNGASVKIKLKNVPKKKRKRVKWSSSNEYTASVNKNGKITGKRLGIVTVTAKYGKKKYKCKVTVASDIDANKITMTYNNSIFTEDLYKRVVAVESVGVRVVDPAAIKLIYSKLAAMTLTETTPPVEVVAGFTACTLELDTGEKVTTLFSRVMSIGDKYYVPVENSSEIIDIIMTNRDYGEY
nr:Ig-like domain-containing protein [Eubacterium sp.]